MEWIDCLLDATCDRSVVLLPVAMTIDTRCAIACARSGYRLVPSSHQKHPSPRRHPRCCRHSADRFLPIAPPSPRRSPLPRCWPCTCLQSRNTEAHCRVRLAVGLPHSPLAATEFIVYFALLLLCHPNLSLHHRIITRFIAHHWSTRTVPRSSHYLMIYRHLYARRAIHFVQL